MWKKRDEIRMFWIIKVQPFYKCSKFMLNLEQVPFNIIEERMRSPRTLDEREHLCHCYACCLVTTVFTVQQTETMHEESLPLRKKKKKRIPYFTAGFEGGISFWDPSSLCGFQHKLVLTMKLTWSQPLNLSLTCWAHTNSFWSAGACHTHYYRL